MNNKHIFIQKNKKKLNEKKLKKKKIEIFYNYKQHLSEMPPTFLVFKEKIVRPYYKYLQQKEKQLFSIHIHILLSLLLL